MNANGIQLLELCNNNNLVVGGTLFPFRHIHKLDWYLLNNRDRSQIDYLLINGTWRRSLNDVKVKRGADVSSDHYLVVALIQLKLRDTKKKIHEPKRFDKNKLQNSKIKNFFLIQVKNRFQALQNAEVNSNELDTMYSKIVSAYTKSYKVCSSPKVKSKEREWIKPDAWEAVDARRTLKKNLTDSESKRLQDRFRQQYKKVNKQVKRMVRADRRFYADYLAAQAEETAAKGKFGQI